MANACTKTHSWEIPFELAKEVSNPEVPVSKRTVSCGDNRFERPHYPPLSEDSSGAYVS